MQCDRCSRPMLPLFTSYVCDHCDGPFTGESFRGFIVYQPERIGKDHKFYVFPSPINAAIWRSANNLQHCEILEVRSLDPIPWWRSKGTLEEITLARELFEIYPDHRYPPRPYRAFLTKNLAAHAN